MDYIEVEFKIANTVENEILIALLSNAGFESFEEIASSLKAFIKEDGFDAAELEAILKIVPVDHTITTVPQQNWNAQWESSFEPITVNGFAPGAPWVSIRAEFHQPVKNVQHEIIITPKMSFGTGHHATTYMMIEQMETLDMANKTVVDFGTGTGVLAILAEKMGALKIDAIDYDEWSIANAGENAASNHCHKINLLQADTIPQGTQYDIVLANINFNIITQNLKAIKGVCKPGTYILFSGVMKADEAALIDALQEYNISPVKNIQKGEWLCVSAVYA